MGSGCVCQNSNSTNAYTRFRTVRLGNLNFMIYGTVHLENKTVGKGCKRTPAWETLATRDEVNRKIDEFWDTRIEGNPEVWKVLRTACIEPVPALAEQIVKASGISMLSGSLMLTFDEVGYRYDLPVYVINEASRYGVEKTLQKLPEDFKGDAIEFSVRCVKFDDQSLSANTTENVKGLKEKYAQKVGIEGEKVRMFYNGKEMKNEMTLHHCGVKQGVVLQAHITA
jgi:hypothetical protein